MNIKYARLGFKKPDFLENQYGIKIYLGTTDKKDWDVEVPKELIDENFAKYSTQNMVFFQVSEELAIEIAEKYTLKELNRRQREKTKQRKESIDERH